jgi:hypothetical protein
MIARTFIRKIRELGRKTGTPVRFDDARRQRAPTASSTTAPRKTVVKDRSKELHKTLVKAMPNQLGLTPEDLD